MSEFVVPVVFIVFNRPEQTRKVFAAIRRVQPHHLLIISDGARDNDDNEKCRRVRDIVANIDWDCKVERRYSEINLGCKKNISTGLDWVFSKVEEAIILEDDCLPDTSFFSFCAELLEKYRNDPRVMQICGYNFASKNNVLYDESYLFSRIGMIWGWATWKRAWQHYDVNISTWPKVKRSGKLKNILGDEAIVNHYNHLFDNYYAQKIDSWDSQWFLACWLNNGLSAISCNNLIQNIGFDPKNAHKTADPNDPRAHIPVKPTSFPLIHPSRMIVDPKYDAYIFRYQLSINHSLKQRLLWFLKKKMPILHTLLKRLK